MKKIVVSYEDAKEVYRALFRETREKMRLQELEWREAQALRATPPNYRPE